MSGAKFFHRVPAILKNGLNPLSLSPLLWLRADLGLTIREDAGTSYVTAWADQSGNGHDFAQATEASQPESASGEILYDGTDDRLVSVEAASVWTFLHEGPSTLAIKLRCGPSQTAYLASTQRGNAVQHGFHLVRAASDQLVYQVTNGSGTFVVDHVTGTILTEDTEGLLIVRLEASGFDIRFGGVSVGSDSLVGSLSSAAPLGTLTVGDLTAGTTSAWAGAINHALAWDRALSDTECEQLEGEL